MIHLSHLAKRVAAAAIVGAGTSLIVKGMKAWRERSRGRSSDANREPNFTAAYPRNSGAKSAVTGGDPEDINAMPSTFDPQHEGPIYDGSDLSKT